MNRLLLAAAAVLALTGTASSAPLTLTGPINGNTLGPQSTSNPCIIAGTQCQQPANFGFNNFTQNLDAIDAYSTTPTANLANGVQGTPYTVDQIRAIVGDSFVVALDVNTTSANSEVLSLFEVIINGVVAYDFTGPANVAPVNQNGNGFADWSLGTISLAGLDGSATVLFHAVMSGLVDGAESFFLVSSTPSQVPLPGAFVLMAPVLGAAGGLGWWRKRRRRLPASHPYAA